MSKTSAARPTNSVLENRIGHCPIVLSEGEIEPATQAFQKRGLIERALLSKGLKVINFFVLNSLLTIG
jgi:hypothetical protein